MDLTEARHRAETEFRSRVAGSLGEWDVSGPEEREVRGLGGVRLCLIFTFARRSMDSLDGPPLRIAVDPDTGETDMLR